jgi:hypothetical protein
MVQKCTINVTGDGHWTFAPTGLNYAGTVDELVPVSSTIIPTHPTMLGTNTDIVIAGATVSLAVAGAEIGATFGPIGALIGGLIGAVAGFISGIVASLGSLIHFDIVRPSPGLKSGGQAAPTLIVVKTVQMSNLGGRILFGPDGAPHRDPLMRLSATSFRPLGGLLGTGEVFLVAKGDNYRHEMRGTASGSYGMVLLGGSCIVVLSTNTASGQNDEITFNTVAGTIGFQTGANRVPLTIEVLAKLPDGSVRLASLATNSSSLANESLNFNGDCTTLTLSHKGPTASYALVLGSVPAHGKTATFVSGIKQIADGQTATFAPRDWSTLEQVVLTTSGQPATTTVLPASALPGYKPASIT